MTADVRIHIETRHSVLSLPIEAIAKEGGKTFVSRVLQSTTGAQRTEKIEVQSGGRLPEWLATHPNPGNRIEHINTVLAQTRRDFTRST